MTVEGYDQRRLTIAVVPIVGAIVSLAASLVLPAGNPIRVLAGLSLFVVWPGIGVELALIRPQTPMPPWERLALIGALGLASSGLASVGLVVVGQPLTATSVGIMCASIAIVGSLVSLADRGAPRIREHWLGTLRLALTLVFIVSGGVIASVLASNESADRFTILAFENPAAARAAIESATTGGGPTTIDVVVESHESAVEEYQVSVDGGLPSPTFSLQPLERRVVQIEVPDTFRDALEIQLLKSGRVDRSLRLANP